MTISNIYPQYQKMQNLAKEAILELPIELPIKVKPLIQYLYNHDNIEIYTYDDYAKFKGFELTPNNMKKFFNSKDAKFVYNKTEDLFILLYNKEMPPIRKAWTFAHELGHYFAGHHFLINDNKKITKYVNNILEQEANCFARELLVPSGLVLYIIDYYNVHDIISFYTVLRSIFKLSKEASFYIAKDLSKSHNEYIEMKIYRKYAQIIALYDNLLTKKIFSKLPTTEDFYSWTIHYQREYDTFAYYYYNNNLTPPSNYLKHYLLEKLICSINNSFKNENINQ